MNNYNILYDIPPAQRRLSEGGDGFARGGSGRPSRSRLVEYRRVLRVFSSYDPKRSSKSPPPHLRARLAGVWVLAEAGLRFPRCEKAGGADRSGAAILCVCMLRSRAPASEPKRLIFPRSSSAFRTHLGFRNRALGISLAGSKGQGSRESRDSGHCAAKACRRFPPGSHPRARWIFPLISSSGYPFFAKRDSRPLSAKPPLRLRRLRRGLALLAARPSLDGIAAWEPIGFVGFWGRFGGDTGIGALLSMLLVHLHMMLMTMEGTL